ncbi:MAG: hypothetical protein Q4P71_06255 [Actinomycetaceae bacterium]|nr:hypothetical protein [Actinomycetaceae bacterium]
MKKQEWQPIPLEYYIKVWCGRDTPEHARSSGTRKQNLGTLIYEFHNDHEAPVKFADFERSRKKKNQNVVYEDYLQFLESEHNYLLPGWQPNEAMNTVEDRSRYKSRHVKAHALSQASLSDLDNKLIVTDWEPTCPVCHTKYRLELDNQDVLKVLRNRALANQKRVSVMELLRAQHQIRE